MGLRTILSPLQYTNDNAERVSDITKAEMLREYSIISKKVADEIKNLIAEDYAHEMII